MRSCTGAEGLLAGRPAAGSYAEAAEDPLSALVAGLSPAERAKLVRLLRERVEAS
jgi:hypothetical protein